MSSTSASATWAAIRALRPCSLLRADVLRRAPSLRAAVEVDATAQYRDEAKEQGDDECHSEGDRDDLGAKPDFMLAWNVDRRVETEAGGPPRPRCQPRAPRR